MNTMTKKQKIGLALGSGGARPGCLDQKVGRIRGLSGLPKLTAGVIITIAGFWSTKSPAITFREKSA